MAYHAPSGRHDDELPRWTADPDPVWKNTSREARFVLALFGSSMLWTLGCCFCFAYREKGFVILAGMPAWVVVGVVAPWLVASAAAILFSLRYIEDDDLEGE